MKYLGTLFLLATAYGQTFDGPAELPRSVPSVVSVSPNTPKVVAASDNLQAALNGAVCGDNFMVDPALTYTASALFKLPTLACDSAHWITIQNSGLSVIDANTRIHPGIPMPKIILGNTSSRLVGGAFVRLIGFEITRLESTAGYTGAFVTPGIGAHDLIFDRVYVHGTPTTESVRGFDISNVTNLAIINSWISDFHCLAPGKCGDSQAIAGGVGTIQDGPYLVQNSYLESAGENVLFGGSSATVVPTDITIRYNDLVKPDSWNPADPSYAPVNGLPWQVKNLFELKTGRRVLFEGNRLIGAWGGFSQTGFGILLTPKNQGGQCPVCAVEDVTIRNNWISKTGEALQLAFTNTFDGFYAAGGGRWSIHNNLFDGLQYSTCYKCGGWTNQLTSVLSPAGVSLHDVSVDHNTFLIEGDKTSSGFLVVGSAPIQNIQYTNNVQYSGTYGIFGTDWAAGHCTYGQQFKPTILSACWTGNSAFTGNAVFVQSGAQTATATKTFPPGNYLFPAGMDPVSLDLQLANRHP